MKTHFDVISTRDAFLARLREESQHREERWGSAPGLYGPEPGWVIYEAKRMLALVNELRAEQGLAPATRLLRLRIQDG